ncbi:MAG: hypothetical protein AB4352_09630 [Hormoscilla sp.]
MPCPYRFRDRWFLVMGAIASLLQETGFLRYHLIFIRGGKRNPVSGLRGWCDRGGVLSIPPRSDFIP